MSGGFDLALAPSASEFKRYYEQHFSSKLVWDVWQLSGLRFSLLAASHQQMESYGLQCLARISHRIRPKSVVG